MTRYEKELRSNKENSEDYIQFCLSLSLHCPEDDYEERKKLMDIPLEELAAEIRSQDTWDIDLSRELCRRAGLEDQFETAVATDFEEILYKASDILNVEI